MGIYKISTTKIKMSEPKVTLEIKQKRGKQGPRPKKNKGRKRKGKGPPQGTGVQQVPGVIAMEDKRTIVRRRPKTRMQRQMRVTHDMPPYAKDWVYRHLDPCGEMQTFKEHSKVPDGAMPNSAVMEFRQPTIIRPPPTPTQLNPQQAISLDGNQWTLTLITLPMFRTPMIIVANMTNAEMTDVDRSNLVIAWAQARDKPIYPIWSPLGDPGLLSYWSTISWDMLEQTAPPDPVTGVAGDIHQFRITSWGYSVYFNTPSLVNQGMVVGAQWACNKSTKDATHTDITVYAHDVNRLYNVPESTSTIAIVTEVEVKIPAIAQSALSNVSSVFAVQNTILEPFSERLPFVYPKIYMTAFTNADTTVRTFVSSHDLISDGVLAPSGTTFSIRVSRSNTVQPREFTLVVSFTIDGTTTTVYNDTIVTGSVYTLPITTVEPSAGMLWSDEVGREVNSMELPPTTTEGIMQSSPKAVYFVLKQTEGFYMPMRIFQPIFNAQQATEARPVNLAVEGLENVFDTGPVDTFDLNYGMGVAIMASMPISAAPAIKMYRDVEIVASSGSLLQGFMGSNEDKNEPALEIVQSFTTHHPFMYPLSYNCLGGLLNIITGVVSKVPILGNVVGAIGNVVQGLLPGVEAGPANTNKAVGNIDELMALLPGLLNGLGLSP